MNYRNRLFKWLIVVFFISITCIFYSMYYVHPFHSRTIKRVIQPFKLMIDNASITSEDEILLASQRQLSNLPVDYWLSVRKYVRNWNKTCARYPNILDLEYSNDVWQTLRTNDGTFQLFNAYFDARDTNGYKPSVRILGMIDRIQPTVVTYCQIWYKNSNKPFVVPVNEYKYIWVKGWGNYKNGILQPYLITCPIPKTAPKVSPAVVNLVENPCDTSKTSLKIIYNQPSNGEKKDFAVCVKGLSFPFTDLSVRLAEWIELLRLVGADKIFFYDLGIHPNVSKLLRYYEDRNIIQLTPMKLPAPMSNSAAFQNYFLKKKIVHKRQTELIPYNDCFYKHMYEYRYVVLLDIDEIIMPVKHQTWSELIKHAENVSKTAKIKERSSFPIQNVYFLDDLIKQHGWSQDIPRHFHMLQHVYRAKDFTKPGSYVKSFFNTRKVLTLHNHYPLSCLGICYSYPVDKQFAQLQHYRSDCVKELKKVCDNFRNSTVADHTIWRYKSELIARVTETLNLLGFFSDLYEPKILREIHEEHDDQILSTLP